MLPDRTSATLLTWLKQHPQFKSSAAVPANTPLRPPKALRKPSQIADRFHLVANLREALQHLVECHRSALAGIVLPSRVGASKIPPSALKTRLPEKRSPLEEDRRQAAIDKRLTRHWQIHALLEQGNSIQQIAQQLHLDRQPIHRCLRLDSTSVVQRHRPAHSNLEAYLPYLLQRWEEGCHNDQQLWRELTMQGYV